MMKRKRHTRGPHVGHPLIQPTKLGVPDSGVEDPAADAAFMGLGDGGGEIREISTAREGRRGGGRAGVEISHDVNGSGE